MHLWLLAFMSVNALKENLMLVRSKQSSKSPSDPPLGKYWAFLSLDLFRFGFEVIAIFKDVFWCLLVDYLMEQLLQHCFIDSEGTCIEYCKYSSMGAPRVADASCQCIRAAKTRCRALEHFEGLMHALVLSLSSG